MPQSAADAVTRGNQEVEGSVLHIMAWQGPVAAAMARRACTSSTHISTPTQNRPQHPIANPNHSGSSPLKPQPTPSTVSQKIAALPQTGTIQVPSGQRWKAPCLAGPTDMEQMRQVSEMCKGHLQRQQLVMRAGPTTRSPEALPYGRWLTSQGRANGNGSSMGGLLQHAAGRSCWPAGCSAAYKPAVCSALLAGHCLLRMPFSADRFHARWSATNQETGSKGPAGDSVGIPFCFPSCEGL